MKKTKNLFDRIPDAVAGKVAAYLSERGGHAKDSEYYEEIKYGAKIKFLNYSKALLYAIIALWLGILPHMAVYIFVFYHLRRVSFGFHMGGSLACLLFSTVHFPVCLAAMYISFPSWALCGMVMFTLLLVGRYAPAPDKDKPFNENNRMIYKQASLQCALTWGSFGLFLHFAELFLQTAGYCTFALPYIAVLSHAIILGLCFQSITLLPALFWLFDR